MTTSPASSAAPKHQRRGLPGRITPLSAARPPRACRAPTSPS